MASLCPVLSPLRASPLYCTLLCKCVPLPAQEVMLSPCRVPGPPCPNTRLNTPRNWSELGCVGINVTPGNWGCPVWTIRSGQGQYQEQGCPLASRLSVLGVALSHLPHIKLPFPRAGTTSQSWGLISSHLISLLSNEGPLSLWLWCY